MHWAIWITIMCAPLGVEAARGSDTGVHTYRYEIKKTVRVTDMYESVTIPCLEIHGCAVWYRYDDSGLTLLTKGHEAVQKSGGKYYVKKTTDPRVYWTHFSIVLRFPRVSDTGVYVCDRDYIAPSGNSSKTTKTPAVQLTVEGWKDTRATAIQMVFFLCIVSFLCLCVEKIRKIKYREALVWDNCRSHKVMRRWLVPMAILFVNCGTLLLIYAIATDDCNVKSSLMKAGLGTGLFGLGILLTYLVLNVVLIIRHSSNRSAKYQLLRDDDNDDDDGQDDLLGDLSLGSPTVVEDIKSIGRIRGMVSTSATEVFMITSSALYRYHTSHTDVNGGFRLECYKRFDSALELMMLAKCEGGVAILSQLDALWKSQVLCVNSTTKTIHLSYNGFNRLSWIHESRVNTNFHAISSQRLSIVLLRRRMDDRLIAIKSNVVKNVLQRPACVVQNSKRQIIVADAAKDDLLVLKNNGELLTSLKASVPLSLRNHLVGCNQLAIGPDDKIYVAGPHSDHILEFSAAFNFEREIHLGTQSNGEVHSITVHNNDLYAAQGDEVFVYSLETGTCTILT